MTASFVCPHCGNSRGFLEEQCRYCGSDEPPVDGPEYATVNLETGGPTVEEALRNVDRIVDRAIECGLRGLVVIHGHGSSGEGGAIRRAFREGLDANFWAHKVTSYAPGEALRVGGEEYSALVERRPGLKALLRRDMMGNPGITVLLLARP